MDFIKELHNQVDILKRDGDSVDETTERVSKALLDLGYALATPRLIRDNVKYYNQDIQAMADIVNRNLLTKEINIKSKNQKKIKIKKNN